MEKICARLEVNSELNMMMKMMVEKPINDFLSILSENLELFKIEKKSLSFYKTLIPSSVSRDKNLFYLHIL